MGTRGPDGIVFSAVGPVAYSAVGDVQPRPEAVAYARFATLPDTASTACPSDAGSSLSLSGPYATIPRLCAPLSPLLGVPVSTRADAGDVVDGDVDWNAKFQEVLEMHRVSARNRTEQVAELRALTSSFAREAERVACIIINELGLSRQEKTIKPIDVGGVAGGEKYKCRGIFYKFAWDVHGIYGSDEMAMAAANHELSAMLSCLYEGVEGLHYPLMTVVDYSGHRITAMSVLPVSPSSLVYGSEDGGKTMHSSSPELGAMMNDLGSRLKLRPHPVGQGEHRHEAAGPGDLEGHKGTDGRFYVLDTARLFPPQPPQEGGSLLVDLFRPEFLAQYPQPLCSDAFTKWTEGDSNAQAYMDDCHEAFRVLTEEIIPKIAGTFDTAAANFERGDLDVALQLHGAGVNVRLMGWVLPHCTTDGARRIIVEEMALRWCKNEARRRMRSQGSTLLELLNLISGRMEDEDVKTFWESTLPMGIGMKYKCLDSMVSLGPLRDRWVSAVFIMEHLPGVVGFILKKGDGGQHVGASIALRPVVKMMNLVLFQDGEEALHEAARAEMRHDGAERDRLVQYAEHLFSNAIKQRPNHSRAWMTWASGLRLLADNVARRDKALAVVYLQSTLQHLQSALTCASQNAYDTASIYVELAVALACLLSCMHVTQRIEIGGTAMGSDEIIDQIRMLVQHGDKALENPSSAMRAANAFIRVCSQEGLAEHTIRDCVAEAARWAAISVERCKASAVHGDEHADALLNLATILYVRSEDEFHKDTELEDAVSARDVLERALELTVAPYEDATALLLNVLMKIIQKHPSGEVVSCALTRATELSSSAVKDFPESSGIWSSRSAVLRLQLFVTNADLLEARAAIEKAISMSPGDMYARFHHVALMNLEVERATRLHLDARAVFQEARAKATRALEVSDTVGDGLMYAQYKGMLVHAYVVLLTCGFGIVPPEEKEEIADEAMAVLDEAEKAGHMPLHELNVIRARVLCGMVTAEDGDGSAGRLARASTLGAQAGVGEDPRVMYAMAMALLETEAAHNRSETLTKARDTSATALRSEGLTHELATKLRMALGVAQLRLCHIGEGSDAILDSALAHLRRSYTDHPANHTLAATLIHGLRVRARTAENPDAPPTFDVGVLEDALAVATRAAAMFGDEHVPAQLVIARSSVLSDMAMMPSCDTRLQLHAEAVASLAPLLEGEEDCKDNLAIAIIILAQSVVALIEGGHFASSPTLALGHLGVILSALERMLESSGAERNMMWSPGTVSPSVKMLLGGGVMMAGKHARLLGSAPVSTRMLHAAQAVLELAGDDSSSLSRADLYCLHVYRGHAANQLAKLQVNVPTSCTDAVHAYTAALEVDPRAYRPLICLADVHLTAAMYGPPEGRSDALAQCRTRLAGARTRGPHQSEVEIAWLAVATFALVSFPVGTPTWMECAQELLASCARILSTFPSDCTALQAAVEKALGLSQQLPQLAGQLLPLAVNASQVLMGLNHAYAPLYAQALYQCAISSPPEQRQGITALLGPLLQQLSAPPSDDVQLLDMHACVLLYQAGDIGGSAACLKGDPDACAKYQEAHAVFERIFASGQPAAASSAYNYACVKAALGRAGEARGLLELARDSQTLPPAEHLLVDGDMELCRAEDWWSAFIKSCT